MNVGANIANPKGSHLNFEHFAGTFGNTHRVEIVTGKCNSMRTSTMYGKEMFRTTLNIFSLL
jgi:hypothetical protein